MKPVVDQEESSQTNQIEPSVMLKLAEAAVQIENYNGIKGSSATTGDDHQGPQRQHELASFLGKCHFCQKKIPYDKNVYMYGDLRGF
ncbi:hypothetical protein O6P43_010604 [Quillaja saponaria]|uniref:FLZ-type domain-containing protein n=1 Tax=Quillaja saponaria TaxID=32244 RepID=A0AAD7Q0Z7_QUISA|nr:hypothetical protein O6P43_010604 [Quillaja saponaria]